MSAVVVGFLILKRENKGGIECMGWEGELLGN